MKNSSIKNWHKDDRPREKAIAKGVQVLSDAELLTILIGKGTAQANALEIAKQLYTQYNNSFASIAAQSIQDLSKSIKGIGAAKAVTIAAALEIGRRRSMQQHHTQRVTNVTELHNYFQPLLQDETVEKAYVLALKSGRVLGCELISTGGFAATVVDIRVIFKALLRLEATSFAVAHNHPSGSTKPSDSDKKITQELSRAGALLNIQLIDHIIVTHTSEYYSFANEGLL